MSKSSCETSLEHPGPIIVIFTPETLEKVVTALSMTKMCHGDLFMEDDLAMHKIIVAIASGRKVVTI